ncbi:OLC1v1021712C2 [Oldenlandia corymbosa var. corymbosa]|uniref:sphingosine kinase n=1 Tax=Oldenlandia corymbosa var. corymbosa TaxID=529605 RepID=A0AAV1BW92_OLDCO|nr:OLC1v1021712C2 [Oldenlandia corymbosa var. corymbosa]
MDQAPEPMISDRVIINGVVKPMTLSAEGQLRWSDRSLDVEKEVLGFAVEGSKIKIRSVVETSAGFCCGDSRGSLTRKSFNFEPSSLDSLRVWCEKLQQYIDSLGRPKRLFVLVNPYGGKKFASKVFIDVVKPLMEDANIEITVQETKHQGHAKEVASTLELAKYDGIVCVSGDGILVEVVNGLLERSDWNNAIRMPIGLVPAGTGNGMAKSLLDSVGEPCAPANAVLAIIRGHKRSLDVATISQGHAKFFSVLMLAWGLVADIDIESEKYRWMGSARIDFYAIKRICSLRKYNGAIKFVPAPGYESYGEAVNDEVGVATSDSESVKAHGYGYQGPDLDIKNLSWRKISGPFVSIWLHNVPWGAEETMAAPDAKVVLSSFYD